MPSGWLCVKCSKHLSLLCGYIIKWNLCELCGSACDKKFYRTPIILIRCKVKENILNNKKEKTND